MTAKRGTLVPYTPPKGTLALARSGEIVPVEVPDATVAEGFLRLSSHIMLSAKKSGARVLGVVSALPSEGKTTAALNLAICMGRTRGAVGRVLLVDGDVKSRTLTKFVGGVEGGSGEASNRPSLRITGFQGVDLLTAPQNDDVLSVHDPDAWAELLGALRTRYRMILVDCPSVLGSPEGTVLPSCVDELVLVVRQGQTPKASIERMLKVVEKKPLGVILNGGRASNAPTRNGRA